MKRILILLIFLFLTSCASTRYEWSSEQGRQCFYMCQTNYYSCKAAGTGGDSQFVSLVMISSCLDEKATCFNQCPDLRRIE